MLVRRVALAIFSLSPFLRSCCFVYLLSVNDEKRTIFVSRNKGRSWLPETLE